MPLPREGRFSEDLSKTTQGDGVFALRGGRKGEDVFLDVSGEEEQVHDLGHASAGDVAAPGHFGEVADLAGVQQFLDVVRQGKQAGDSGDGAPGLGFRLGNSGQPSRRRRVNLWFAFNPVQMVNYAWKFRKE